MSDKPKCREMVHPAYLKRQGLPPNRCPFNATRDGLCSRHHPANRLVVVKRQIRRTEQRLTALEQTAAMLRVQAEALK